MKTRRRRAVAATFAVLAVVLAACTSAPQVEVEVPEQIDSPFDSATAQQLEDAVTRAMAAAGASGAVVGVWAPWSGQWVAGVGTEKHGGGEAVDPDTVFHAAMMTRAMTCDALYLVAEDGRVSLDDSVAEYVSGVADLKDVTLAQLCAGTSGIGSYKSQLFGSWLSVPHRVWTARELASYGTGVTRTSEPGVAFRDSDAGYLLLGLALERATGKTSAEILEEKVFTPLELESTWLPASPSADVPGILTGYHSLPDAEGVMNCTDPWDVTSMTSGFGFTDSGVVTDIHDLGRYAQALAAGSLMPEKSTRFDSPLPVYADAPSWYTTAGGALKAGSLVGQAGSVPGSATAAFADPDSGLTVAVVLNNSVLGTGVAQNLAWQLAAIASKAPASGGGAAPEAGLPWTAEQYGEAIAASAVCPLPEAPAAEPEG